ncbi:cadherin-17 isoform X2 [Mugil cephalus]|nr:cadherin-17 isoform X2 [Mugil cephalus]
MTPMVHLLLLPFLLSITCAKDLEEKKGPFENTVLEVPEGTVVPYAIHQFLVTDAAVHGFRLSGEGSEDIEISKDGWLFLEKALDWSIRNHYIFQVEALGDDDAVVLGPIIVTINVVDINNNAPRFNQTVYTAIVREKNPAGVSFTQVFATDEDDPDSPNARLHYSLVTQIPNSNNILLFQVNPNTGEISTTREGQQLLKAREGIQYSRGEDRTTETLERKFSEYCAPTKVPYNQNPFFTCVQRAEMRRQNLDPLEDPDFTLFLRVQDLGGDSETALSGTSRVNIVVQQNLWNNPGPLKIKENLKGTYPMVIAKVQSNDPHAIYSLLQKEREPKFPFQIRDNGEIVLTEALDREDKDMYILVVLAKDVHDKEVDPPMEIQVLVEDENDNEPVCEHEESVFEVQEDEELGSRIGQLLAHDADEEGTLHSKLTYTIESETPALASKTFSIDDTGLIQSLRLLRRKEQQVYNLVVKVSDSDFSTNCKVLIKVIDVNNEMPVFEKNNYGRYTVAEDTPVGHTVLNISASDADDPASGSSFIQFIISAGNEGGVFAVITDGKGIGSLVIAKPLDFETTETFNLQIDARNPEPLMKGLEYGSESTAIVSVSVTDVDELPKFSQKDLEITVPENTIKGTALLTVEAADPEGKEINYKMEGDEKDWLEIDSATGQIKTKKALDREELEAFDVTVTAFEKENPEKSSEQVVHVRLLDVNDNYPKLTESQAFICMQNPKPIILKAKDGDSDPFSAPFNFTFDNDKKSANWQLKTASETTAQLILKKKPTEEKNVTFNINIKDNAGMGVTHMFHVMLCNCTQLGHCYMAPDTPSKLGMAGTVGIFAGIIGFCLILFVIVIKRINKGNKKRKALGGEEERNMM